MFIQRYWRWWIEATFVLISITLLKIWVFPFFISIWFPTNDLSSLMLEWTLIMVGIITCFIYIGLGSSAKFSHRLSLSEAIICFFIIHIPLLLPEWAGMLEIKTGWKNMIGDLFALFFPKQSLPLGLMFSIYFSLFLFGRGIQVQETYDQERDSLTKVTQKNR
ncbi:hypothetical protein [Hazenella coriacea]|uniref:Uncharacterized protein n=1 Tax=Hazenella coriacea TaxID=1179467 RepID=A0A4R3L3X1_9BACL|nr:hypothetical protein [Hazenella coriacea]TCS93380.1 hypothetical protein EDD58_10726 [Hazenella coriacea]